ncbi:MAG TPA: ATP-dependent DNA helicase [Candidatus Saccharimonadales bacterium]|nr:ATP-dependent DNA helicase [Candidatus Saccharimonadales bacterium]
MQSYEEVLDKLNDNQRLAVEAINGPVLVIAGPGTGKTQLLSTRVGAILRHDPGMLPSNILCLTFTDSAAANLRDRLITNVGLGQEAYHVAIHTFNSFGAWIMSTYPEYFFAWREAATADELTTYRLLEGILDALPGDHPLAAQGYDDSYFAIKQVQHYISDCKRANVSPAEARTVIAANQLTYQHLGAIINQHWPNRMTDAGALAAIANCTRALENAVRAASVVAGLTDIGTLLLQELHAAETESDNLSGRAKTKPFTAWKSSWLELDADKKWTFKAAKHTEKLLAACDIYQQYQAALAKQGLVDFEDQIVVVLAALAAHEELRLNLQERFQYIMIDEYQDTNRAQLQMVQYLTDAPVHEGRPNVLVVGDDDQAIYRFQGADMSNVAAFEAAYQNPTIIPLRDNYRSNQAILTPARRVSAQLLLSLEKQKGISKELAVHIEQQGSGTQLHEFAHETEHYAWIAAEIKRLLTASKQPGKNIAVLARKRSQLDALVPYLRDQQVPIDYERRENVLDQPHVVALLTLARFVQALGAQQLDEANALLPEVLSHPMWQIAPADLWRVARTAHRDKRLWLDIIFEENGTPLRTAADFLYGLSQQAGNMSLEQMLDALIGLTEPDADRAEIIGPGMSPFKHYFFGDDLLNEQPLGYLTLLSHLSCLRRHVRSYQQNAGRTLLLNDLIDFVDAYNRAGLVMLDTSPHREDSQAVRLMTIHKAKGQEFETVFLIGMTTGAWSKTGSNNQRFSYPQNLRELKPSDNDDDDALRLLFVAMTRARQSLHICYFRKTDDGKAQQLFAPLVGTGLTADTPSAPTDAAALVSQYEERWMNRHASVTSADKHALLAPVLEGYRLSATHFCNFLDVSRGGPLYFLTENLLHFPHSLSPHASFGVAVHATLHRAHEQVARGEKPSIPQLLQFFRTRLMASGLSTHDLAQFTKRGDDHLHAFLKLRFDDFNAAQRSEADFGGQGVVLGAARLTGSLDLMDIDPNARSVMVTDYKTGKPFTKWDLPASSPEHDRMKLHRYRQQLLFYKLLVDNANDWGSKGWRAETGIVQFIEPDLYGKLHALIADYGAEEMARITQLIQVVWQHIQRLDFPDVGTTYSPDLAGVQQFEDDLLSGSI